MTPLLLVGGIVGLGLLGFLAWKISNLTPAGAEKEELLRMSAQLKANLEQKSEEVGKLKETLDAEKAEKQEQQGKSKQLFAQHTKLESELEHVMKERDSLQKELAKYEEASERRKKEEEAKMTKLDAAIKSFEDEKTRVRREDEEAQRVAEEERDRVWTNHEVNVIATLTELCKQPQYAFSCFTNTNLPDGFEGSLKPDFMIDFLDQYIIFDAKKSKSESLQTYISNTVKTTVAKVKKNPKIASTIYLVVPTEAIGELKAHYHPHDGYTLYVVSPESLAPILASLKRITTYDKMEGMDPQQRENIVNFIADADIHIGMRNSTDIMLTKHGVELLDNVHRIDPVLSDEIALKKQEKLKNLPNIMNNAFKKLVASADAQLDEVHQLVSPKASVKKKDLEAAESLLSDSLF